MESAFFLAELSRMNISLVPEIAIFIRTLELGTFAAVATETGFTSSGISRIISRLEDRLNVKLLYRSTRRLALTPEGEIFLDHAKNIKALAEAAVMDVSRSPGHPRGHLRVNCGTAFARHKLASLVPKFLHQYPQVTIDISVSDARIDPVTEQADVTIRVGPLVDSDLVAIRLGTVKRIIAASPSYLADLGTPQTIQDLRQHQCLLLKGFPKQARWPMLEDGNRSIVQVSGSVTSDSADMLLHLAIEGAGIIRLGDFLGEKALASGELVSILLDNHDPERQAITALVLPGRQNIPRIRVFVDMLKALAT